MRRASGTRARLADARHGEHPQERGADELEDVRRLGERDRAAADDVDDRGAEETHGERGDEGEQSQRAQWSPGGEDEAHRQRDVPRADLVRDVYRRALVAAEQQRRDRQRDLRHGHGDQAEPQRGGGRAPGVPFGSGCGQDEVGDIGRARRAGGERAPQRARVVDESPARGACPQVVGDCAGRDVGGFTVERGRAGFANPRALHASHVVRAGRLVPASPRS